MEPSLYVTLCVKSLLRRVILTVTADPSVFPLIELMDEALGILVSVFVAEPLTL